MEKIGKVVFLVLCLLIPQPIIAGVMSNKRFSNWVYLDVQYRNGGFSCQATQCITEYCQLGKNFLFNTGRGEKLVVPEFNHGAEYPTNSEVRLNIGNQTFQLINSSPKNKRFYIPKTAREAIQINRLLLSLEKSAKNAKFQVIDKQGQKRTFSVRGVNRVFSEIEKKCNVPLP